MCDRSPLFLPEAKSIIMDLLKRTLELFNLSIHFIEYHHLHQFLSKREENRDYPHFSLRKTCKLNYNIISDLNKYLHRLSTSCRLTKSHLRALHAARLTSSNDYIVIDDEIYEFIKRFRSKLSHRQYHFQRQIHSSHAIETFMFNPEASDDKNNSPTTIPFEEIFASFEKISQFYQLLLQRLYGVRTVRDSDILQPIVIHIIHLLLSITNKFKEDLSSF